MELKIIKVFRPYKKYIIDSYNCLNESAIAKKLNIPTTEYGKILLNNGATYVKFDKEHQMNNWCYYEYYFNTLQNAKNVIKILEPYLILTILTE